MSRPRKSPRSATTRSGSSSARRYPGYIMVQMELNEKTWFVVRETPGVGDFVGAHGTPTKMTDAEVNQMLHQEEEKTTAEAPKVRSTSSAATASRSRTARSRTSRGPSRRSSRAAAWSRSCSSSSTGPPRGPRILAGGTDLVRVLGSSVLESLSCQAPAQGSSEVLGCGERPIS